VLLRLPHLKLTKQALLEHTLIRLGIGDAKHFRCADWHRRVLVHALPPKGMFSGSRLNFRI